MLSQRAANVNRHSYKLRAADRHALPPNGKAFEKGSDSHVYGSNAPWPDGWFGRVCPMLRVGCSSRRVEDNAPYLRWGLSSNGHAQAVPCLEHVLLGGMLLFLCRPFFQKMHRARFRDGLSPGPLSMRWREGVDAGTVGLGRKPSLHGMKRREADQNDR